MNQEPKPILDGLRKFYEQYDAQNVPSDEQLTQLATDYAGREGEMWTELITHYTKQAPPQDHIDQLVQGFENPFLKDASESVIETGKKKTNPLAILDLPKLWIKHLYWISSRMTTRISLMR